MFSTAYVNVPEFGTITESISVVSGVPSTLYNNPKSPSFNPEVVMFMVLKLVKLSESDIPESSFATRSGAVGASGAVKSTVITDPELAAEVLPAESITT